MADRLLVTGSRKWTAARPIDQQIRLTADALEVVIEGEAQGADRLARAAAERYGVRVLPFRTDWSVHAVGWCHCRRPGRICPSAGPRRNRQMLDAGRPTLVVAFTDDFSNPHSGTRGMCRMAVMAGVPVTLVEHGAGGMCFSRELGKGEFR